MKRQALKTILFALPKVLDLTARRFPMYRARLKERNLIAWIGLMDESIGRVIEFRNGRIRSHAARRARSDVRMAFKDVATALKFLSPNPDQGEIIHAAKNFKVVTEGEDELLVWLMQTLAILQTGTLGAAATVDCNIQQAQDGNGTNAKAIAGAAIVELSGAGGANVECEINLDAQQLDVANGFCFVNANVIVGAAASETSLLLLGFVPRVAPPTNVASVVQVVN